MKTMMLDKCNFTSNLSLDTTVILDGNPKSFLPIKSALKNITYSGLPSGTSDGTRTSIDATGLPTEIPVETLAYNDRIPNHGRGCIPKFSPSFLSEHLGLHEFKSSDDISYFSGVIYLPECYVVLVHYLTLYRLRLDSLEQHEFENWCLTMGHTETSCKYLQLRKVYMHLKADHFKEAFIINRIMSRQNIDLRISDSFGDPCKRLRAFVFVGRRSSSVKSVVDCYCFNVRGRIQFIIKSTEDYKNLLNFFNQSRVINSYPQDFDACSYDKCSETSNTLKTFRNFPKIVTDSSQGVIKVLNMHPNSVNTLRHENYGDFIKSEDDREVYPNYMRYQGYHADVSSVCYNSQILYDGITYNLVSLIADKRHAYILCKNSFFDLNYCSETDLHSLISEKGDQSFLNENRFNMLESIVKKEICDSLTEKCYGISLEQVPCGLFYVVQCTIDGDICEMDSFINSILMRHMVCGKVISKEYNSEIQTLRELYFMMHVYGNEHDVLSCSNELKIEGLGRNFKLIHPQSEKSIQESMTMFHEI